MKVQRTLLAIAVFALVATLAPIAHADTIIYSFSGTNTAPGGDGLAVAFQFTSGTFLTATPPPFGGTALVAAQLDSCTNCLDSLDVPAIVFHPNNVVGDTIDFNDVNNVGSVFSFSFGAFGTPGTYISSAPFNPGTLTVTKVPEPETIAFLMLGLFAVAGSQVAKKPQLFKSI